MLYELINPSDPYTFRAESREIAVLAAVLLSSGFGVRELDGEDWMAGPFLFMQADDFLRWFAEEFHADISAPAEFDAYVAARRLAIADAFDSFVIGCHNDRLDYEEALQAIDDPAKREAFRRARQDRRRTSRSRIGETAWRLAEQLRAAAAPTPEP
jgi:hypothetical protein